MFFLMFSFELKAENWIFYSDLGGKGFYDKDSIKSVSGKTITVWTKLLPTQEAIDANRYLTDSKKKLTKEGKYPFKIRQVNDDELSYQKTFDEISCDSGSYKYLKFIFYNKSDEIIYSSDDDDKKVKNHPMNKVHYFSPGTPGYKFYEEICSYKFDRRSEKRNWNREVCNNRFPKRSETGNWIFYAASDTDNGYYDKSSIKKIDKNVVRVWIKNIYNESGKQRGFSYLESIDQVPENTDILNHQLILLEIDCVNKKIRNSSVIIYDKKNNCLFSNGISGSFGEWEDILPSLEYIRLKNTVCSEVNSKTKMK